MDRAAFDYFLESLTSRKQELDFERFARKLAEEEICPNLIPQTGPSGGGDSKVDSETYPVSEEVATLVRRHASAGALRSALRKAGERGIKQTKENAKIRSDYLTLEWYQGGQSGGR